MTGHFPHTDPASLQDEDGARFPADQYGRLARGLTDQFGGDAGFARSPAEGRWKQGEHDEIVVMEVMMDELDGAGWADSRERLAREFRQSEIVIRCQLIERL